MKKDLYEFRKLLCFSAAVLLFNLPSNSQSFKLYGVSDMVRVFEDGYKLPQFQDSIKIFGIRGEVISGQFVITAKKELTGVKIEIGEMKNANGGVSWSASAIEWNFVGSIPLTQNTPNQPVNILTRQAPARFPEYLMAEKKINVKHKAYQSVWLTVSIPETAEAGVYTGKISVQSDQGDQSLPITLEIFPLNIPSARHLKVVEWMSTSGFPKFHGINEMYSPEWFGMLKIYADNMVAHRQNIFQVPLGSVEISKSKNGELSFDFSKFDRIANVFWNSGKMDFMATGGIGQFADDKWASTSISAADHNIKSEETGEIIKISGKDLLPYLLPAFESHLRQKGWLQKTFFGIHDEPSIHNAIAWKDLSSYVHKYAPDLKRIDAIETTFLLGEIEVAVPKLDHFANWNDTYKKWQEKGNELWFYSVGIYQGSLFPNKTIDVPLMDTRLMHWLNYKYDATGYLHWGWNQWNEDPYKDVGMHIGDAWHVYPVKDGVLNSLRWEEMRNGIQDYEYFWMLENKIKGLKDSLGSVFSWIDPKQRGKEIAGEVLYNFTERTNDPKVVCKTKLKIISELMEFNTSPRVYVQTNPVEKSTLTTHSSVEVMGWTEPGTKIIINGAEIPVGKDGLFLEQFGGDFIDHSKITLGDKIVVRAIAAGGTKTIIRNFKIR